MSQTVRELFEHDSCNIRIRFGDNRVELELFECFTEPNSSYELLGL